MVVALGYEHLCGLGIIDLRFPSSSSQHQIPDPSELLRNEGKIGWFSLHVSIFHAQGLASRIMWRLYLNVMSINSKNLSSNLF